MQRRDRAALILALASSLGGCSAPGHELHASSAPQGAVHLASPAPETRGPSIRGVNALCSAAPLEEPLDMPVIELEARGPSPKNLRAWVDLLSHPRLEGRGSGSRGSRQVAFTLSAALADAGFSGGLAGNEFCQSFEAGGVRDQNVVARLGPRPAKAATKALILGAHYDGQGRCGPGGEICPSADDNASGVSALLEVARILGSRSERPEREVVIALFGAEERGILGSRYFVAHPPIALERVAMMINLDMVGRPFLDGHATLRLLLGASASTIGYVFGDRDRASSQAALERSSARTGTEIIGVSERWLRGSGFSSDSVPFSPFVPTLFLSTSIHDDYHAPGDTAAKVDIKQIERVIGLILSLLSAD